MLITAKTWNGHDIQSGDYEAVFLNPSTLPGAKPVFIDQPQADSDYSGMFTVDVRNVALSVRIKNYANRHALLAQLKQWFKRGTKGDAVATFEVDGKDYLLSCVVTTAPVSDGSWYFTIILQTGATAWRAVTADTETYSPTGAGGTHTLTVEGDDETLLSVSLTPTVVPTSAYLYHNIYTLAIPSGITYGVRPWMIQINTAALVTAGKMQADCDDLRVFIGSQSVPRWISGPNTTTTKIWFNANMAAGVTSIDVKVVYGNVSATAPSTGNANYDDTKPLFNLSSSDNTTWIWDATTLFYDPTRPGRTGGWISFLSRQGTVSDDYNESENVDGAAPALGAQIGAWLKGSVWQKETASVGWKFYSPGGIQTVSLTGQKWKNSTSWPKVAGLQYQRAGNTKWNSAWNESAPGSLSSWTAWTHNTVSITNTSVWLQLIFSGTLANLADALAMFEGLTATVVFTSANVPTGSFAGEQSNYYLDIKVKNNLNGDQVELVYPMRLNKTFALDGEAFTAKYDGASDPQAMTLNDPARSAWIRLQPGSNEMAVTSADLGHLTVLFSYYRRRL